MPTNIPKTIISILLIIAFHLTLGGCGQGPLPPSKPYKIAIINPDKSFSPLIKIFKTELSYLDYHQGTNTIYLDNGPIKADRIPQVLAFLKTQEIDLLYTLTTPVSEKAYEVFKGSGIPILFGPVYSPLKSGLTNSLSKPDKNVTGVMTCDNTTKVLGFLDKTIPSLKCISAPFPGNKPTTPYRLEDLREKAKKLGVKIITTDIRNQDDIENYLQHMPTEADAIWLPHSPFDMIPEVRICNEATAGKIPVVAVTSRYVNDALFTYSPNLQKIARQLAHQADKLLQGSPASEIPVEKCTYELSVNLEAAVQNGINIPDIVMNQAQIFRSAVHTPSPAELP